MDDATCLFCRIVAGELPSRRAHEDDQIVAFHDIAPRAPTHILLVPREHIPSVLELTKARREQVAEAKAAAAATR